MSDPLAELDYYTLLGVEPDADATTIRKAFRAFARRYHPDRHARKSEERRLRATEIYRRGSEGLQVLLDPSARRLYDRALAKGIRRLTADQRDSAARREQDAGGGRDQRPRIQSIEAKAHYDRAVAAVREGDHREAWKSLRKALSIEPSSDKLRKALAEVEALLRRA